MKICVLGLGYVGLPTALKLAEAGHNVVGCDIDVALLRSLESGDYSSAEPGVNELLAEARRLGRIRFEADPEPADAFILAVPTPVGPSHEADLSAVEMAVRSLQPVVVPGNVVVLESTVPPGTTARLMQWLGTEGVLVAHVPERVLPGKLLAELVGNDRIIGGVTLEAARAAEEIYRSFVSGKLFLTSSDVAEVTKLAENAYRDINIAFANELTRICHALGVSARDVIALANRHPRVNILMPGAGVGGHCVAVDPWFLVQEYPRLASVISAGRGVNDGQPLYAVGLLRHLMGGALEGQTVAVLGLAYKGNVADGRESPSVSILNALSQAGAEVLAHDPLLVQVGPWKSQPLDEVVGRADAIIVAADHEAFRTLSAETISQVRPGTIILDTRGILDTDTWAHFGHVVYHLGDDTQFIPSDIMVSIPGPRWR